MENFTAVCNELIDSGNLDPYQGWILVRIARRGICFESQRSMADGMNMSLGKVNKTLKWLHENGYIEQKEDERYGRLGWSVVTPGEQMQQNYVSPHEHDVLPGERSVSPGEQAVSPGERHLNKTNIKRPTKKIKEEDIYIAHDLNADFQNALALVAKEKLAPGFNEKKYEDAAFAIMGWEAELSQVAGFADYWRQKGWHPNEPSLTNIVNHWHDYLADRDLSLKPSSNGHKNGRSSSIPKPAPAEERTPGAY